MRTIHRTSCPRDCYSRCGLLATVENGRVIKIKGDPLHPVASRPCLKGLAYVEHIRFLEKV